jgi:hypothetical protein
LFLLRLRPLVARHRPLAEPWSPWRIRSWRHWCLWMLRYCSCTVRYAPQKIKIQKLLNFERRRQKSFAPFETDRTWRLHGNWNSTYPTVAYVSYPYAQSSMSRIWCEKMVNSKDLNLKTNITIHLTPMDYESSMLHSWLLHRTSNEA